MLFAQTLSFCVVFFCSMGFYNKVLPTPLCPSHMSATPPFPIFKLKLKLSRPPQANETPKETAPAIISNAPIKIKEKTRERLPKLAKPIIKISQSRKVSSAISKTLAPVTILNIFGYAFECYSYCSAVPQDDTSGTFVCHVSNCHKIFNSKEEWQDHINEHI